MKKEALIPLIVFVIISILLISGCSTRKTDILAASQNKDNNLELDKKECWSDRDCQDGKICINKLCLEFYDISECEELTGMFSKEKCVKSIAVKNNDPDICKKMEVKATTISTLEIDCYTKIALAKNDDSVCDILMDIKSYMGSFIECQQRFAISKLDSSYCNKITYKIQNWITEEEKEDCIRRVNFAKSHPDFPKEELMATWKYLAKQTNNESYCEYSTSSFDKKDCEEYFGIKS